MQTSKRILQNMQAAGHRLTPARRAVIEILASGHTLLTADEIRSLLSRKKESVNKTTVYREMEFLLGQNLVQEVDFGDGKKRYELNTGDHHHHLVCTNCNRVDEIKLENDLASIERSITKLKKFQIRSHALEFFGLCKNCK